MSKTIDEKVVRMKFDNKRFESGVKDTLSSLDKLKSGLNFDEAGRSVKKFDLSPLTKGVEAVRSKFSALEVMAVTALANITNSAVNAGKQIVSSLTVEPVKQGFDEYETKMGSVQTIMASTGETLETVDGYLDELNTYADKTIYSFSDMTASIGKFTNAGVSLDKAVKAIQGISNEAAVSGANSNEASRAMYNFAQALSAGSVKLIDWKSIENANMATVEFKQQLIDTAVKMGTLVKQGDKYISTTKDANGKVAEAFDATSMFNDSLSAQWMTSDVLIETLGRYADETTELGKKAYAAAQDVKTFSQLMDTLKEAVGSGWSESFELMFGDFEEAKKLWTSVSEVVGGFIGRQSDARNELLKGWKDLGGRDKLIESVKNSFDGLISVVTPIKEAFSELFPAVTSQQLYDLTKKLADLTAKMKLSPENAEKVKTAFRGLFSIFKMGIDLIKAVAGGIKTLLGNFKGVGGSVLNAAAAVGNWFTSLRKSAEESDFFNRAVGVVVDVMQKIIDSGKELVVTFKTSLNSSASFKDALSALGDVVAKVSEKISGFGGPVLGALSKVFGTLVELAKKVGAVLGKVFSGFGDMFDGVFSSLSNALSSGDFSSLLSIFNVSLLSAMLIGIKKISGKIKKALSGLTDKLGNVLDGLSGVLDSVRSSLKAWQNDLNAGTLLKIAGAVGILAISLVVLAGLDSGKLDTGLKALTGIFTDLCAALIVMQKGGGAARFAIAANALIPMATAVLILAAALKKVADIDPDRLAPSVLAIAGLYAEMTAAFRFAASGKPAKGAVGMVLMAAAIKILASVCKELAELDWEGLGKGLLGVGVLLAELDIFTNTAKVNVSSAITAVGLIELAAALKILASVAMDFAGMEWEEIGKGLSAMTVMLAELAAFTRLTSGSKGSFSKAFSGSKEGILGSSSGSFEKQSSGITSVCFAMIELGAAMKIFASAAHDFAELDWEELGKSLTSITVILAALAGFTKIVSKTKKLWGTVAVLIAAAAAIKMMVGPMKEFAALDTRGIAKGLTVITGTLMSVAMATRIMKPQDMLEASTLLPVLAYSLKDIGVAFAEIGKLSWEDIAKGLVSFAASIGVLAAALKLAKGAGKSAGSIVAVSIALIMFGAAIRLMGSLDASIAALVTLAATFLILGKALKAMKSLIPTMYKFSGSLATLSLSLTLFGVSLAAFGVGALTAFGAFAAIIRLFKSMSWESIGKGFAIAAAGLLGLGAAAKLLKRVIPTMYRLCGVIATFGLSCIAVAASMALIITSLGMLAGMGEDAARETARAIITIAKEFLDGIPQIADSLITGLSAIIRKAVEEFAVLAPVLLRGVFDALLNSADVIKEYIPQIVSVLLDFVCDILDTVTESIPKVGGSVTNLIKAICEVFTSSFTKDELSSAMTGITSISAAFLELATAAKFISEISIGGTVKGVIGFAAVVSGLGLILTALGGISKIPGVNDLINNGAKIFGSIGNAIGAFISGVINGIVNGMPSDLSKLITAFGGIELVAAAMLPLSEILGALAENKIGDTLKGLANFGIILAGITAVLAALGGLSAIPGFNDVISNGSTVLSAIGTALGAFVGSIVDGLAGAVSSSFEGIISALLKVGVVVAGVAGVAKIVSALKLNPASVALGFAGVAVAIGCLEVILAALGGLAQIPGFDWIIGEGGKALVQIGTILGEFVGSIIGGIGTGISAALPGMGENLSAFMTNVTPFIEGAKGIDGSMMTGVAALCGAILALTATEVISGIASFFTGGNSVQKFGADIAAFGTYLKQFSDNVEGIMPENVAAAADAGVKLAEMCRTIPNEGGLVSLFTGDNNVAKWGQDIVGFGTSIKQFSDNVAGITPENVLAAANAGKALADMCSIVPNEGGVAGWFAGENSVAKWGEDIASFGTNLKAFDTNVAGITPANVLAAANAGKALADMCSVIPNEGGVAGWFAGENSVAKWGEDIAGFGVNLKAFDANVAGITPENVLAAANAGKALADMCSVIPNEGGVAGWFAGENSVAKWGEEIASFGINLKAFDTNVAGIIPENVLAAANAGKALADMCSVIPNEGGVAGWFAGENSVAKFGEDIASFGVNLKAFDTNVAGITPENIKAAAEAGKNLAAMCDTIPNEGGVAGWFAGENNVAKFGKDIASFGTHLADFSYNVANINPENIKAAAEAGKNLAEMVSVIPKEGGIKAWFSGENNVAKFGSKIADFGKHLKTFDSNVAYISPSGIKAAADAGMTLANLANTNPNGDRLDEFGKKVIPFGMTLSDFGKAVSDTDVSNADKQVGKIYELSRRINGGDLSGLVKFSDTLKTVAEDGIKNYIGSLKNGGDDAESALSDISNKSLKAVRDMAPDFESAGGGIVDGISDGISSGEKTLKERLLDIIEKCKTALEDKKKDFKALGTALVEGFAGGMGDPNKKVPDAARKMAASAMEAVRDELGIHSPSREMYSLAEYAGSGFVIGLSEYADRSYDAGVAAANSAKEGLADAIAGIADIVDGEVECTPTIRPVLDLTDVENGASKMNGLFAENRSVTIAARTSAEMAAYTDSAQRAASGNTAQAVNALRQEVDDLAQMLKAAMDTGAVGETVYNFNQTLNSPQALDALTIHRQTKNMFAKFALR